MSKSTHSRQGCNFLKFDPILVHPKRIEKPFGSPPRKLFNKKKSLHEVIELPLIQSLKKKKTIVEIETWLILPVAYACLKD